MSEWHLTPEWILDNWTGEEFTLMVNKLSERKKRLSEAISRKPSKEPNIRKVTDSALFRQMGNRVKVIKDGN